MTTIIGLMGPAGSGKSTVAAYLVEKYGAKRFSLAEPLKEIAMRTLNFDHDQVYGSQAKKEATDPRYGFSPRWFLQRLGTEGCRAVLGENVWIRALLTKIGRTNPRLAVVEDVRYLNEAEAIESQLDGHVWRLLPPGDDETAMRAAAAGEHPSEREWFHHVADVDIMPKVRGKSELLVLVDQEMRDMVLEHLKVTREVS